MTFDLEMAKLFLCALLALVMAVHSFRVQPFSASTKQVSTLNKFRGGALNVVTDRPPTVRSVMRSRGPKC